MSVQNLTNSIIAHVSNSFDGIVTVEQVVEEIHHDSDYFTNELITRVETFASPKYAAFTTINDMRIMILSPQDTLEKLATSLGVTV